MQDYSSKRLFEKLENDVVGKWHPEARAGNDGNAGNTLEDLLGVSENNLKLPDWGEIELKTKRVETQSLVTLLHREPMPAASVPNLLLSLGWKHSGAGSKYNLDELSFRSTTRAEKFSDRGFAVMLTDEHIKFIFDKTKVNFDAKDRTGAYATYGDWLSCVESRTPHYAEFLPVFWDRHFVEKEIKAKLDNTLLCLVKSKSINGMKHFQYTSARLFSGFNPSKLDTLFKEHALYVDFDARTRHNHGTKFRIDLKSIGRLFDNVVEIF